MSSKLRIQKCPKLKIHSAAQFKDHLLLANVFFPNKNAGIALLTLCKNKLFQNRFWVYTDTLNTKHNKKDYGLTSLMDFIPLTSHDPLTMLFFKVGGPSYLLPNPSCNALSLTAQSGLLSSLYTVLHLTCLQCRRQTMVKVEWRNHKERRH